MRQLARLSAGYVFMHGCMAGTRMTAPLLALRDGYSEAAVGVLMALFALAQVFLALPAGRFADRRGFKLPMRWSITIAATGAGLAAAFPVFPVLCLSALMTGGATGMGSIAVQRHVGRVAQTPTQMKQAFSWMAIGPAMANFLGPFAAGFTIDHAGFRAAFFLMALLPVVSWFLLRPLHETPLSVAVKPAAGQRAWDLWKEPALRRLLLVNWFLSSCWDVHTFMVPVLGHERGLSASVIGAILGAFAMAAASIRLVLPIVAANIREWVLIMGAMLATAVFFALYPFLHAAIAMGMCSVMLGFALGSVQPMVMSMLHQITPEHRQGEAVAMRMMVINASSVVMPMLFGMMGALVGVSAVFWLVSAWVGAGSRVAFGLKDALKDDRTSG